MPVEGARRATGADVDALVRLGADAAAQLQTARGGPLFLVREGAPPTREEWAALIESADHEVLVGVLDEEPVGYAIVTTEALADGSTLGLLRGPFVESGGREVGVGEALLEASLTWCEERRASRIDALALPGERGTKNFFEAAGFKARLLTVHRTLPRGSGQ